MKPINIKSILLCSVVAATATSTSALSPTDYTTQSALAGGRWVKIAVKNSGIQQITPEQLQAWGFDNPQNVKVYGYGGTKLCTSRYGNMPDDITPTPSTVTEDGRILFYGAADYTVRPAFTTSSYQYDVEVMRNTYSLAGYYFLTDGDVAPTNASVVSHQASSTVQTTHLALCYEEEELLNPASGGAVFIGRGYNAGETLPFDAKVRDYATISPYGPNLSFVAHIYSSLTSSGNYSYTLSLPEAFTASLSQRPSVSTGANSAIRAYKSRTYAVLRPTQSTLDNGTYTFQITSPTSANIQSTSFDYAYLVYPRKNVMSADEHQLDMFIGSATAGDNFAISNARPTTCVWDVTDPAAVVFHEVSYNDEDATATFTMPMTLGNSVKPECLVAFNTDDTHLAVEFAGEVANQNLHGLDVPNMLIITTKELYDKACELADMHRQYQGMSVVVVTQDQVFNEFSSGTPAVHAYRRLAKMFYDRNQSKMQSLLLYGSGWWDNRGITGIPPQERLLTYQAEFNYPKTSNLGYDMSSYIFDCNISYCSDTWMGMLDDNFTTETLLNTVNEVHIGVGRLPVLDNTEAEQANAKVLDILQNPMSTLSRMNTIFITDVKKSEGHILQGEEAADRLLTFNDNYTANREHVFLYPRDTKQYRQMLADKFAQGLSYFSYAGHGGPASIGAAFPIWTNDDINANSYTSYPFGMLSTCDTYTFDRSDKNFAKNLVLKKNGGMSAVTGSCRTVIMERNQLLNVAMAESFAMLKGNITAGEVFRRGINRALTQAPTSTGALYRANTLSYNLCGDPAVPYVFPLYEAKVTTPSSGSGVVKADPMSTFTIEGTVNSYAGTLQTSYNGTATITIYETPHIEKLKPNSSDESITQYIDGNRVPYTEVTVDHMPLVSVNVPVKNGVFKADIVLPYATYTGAPNRVLITTIDQNNRIGSGVWKGLQITDNIAEAPADATAPQITEFYLDSPTFTEGDIVAKQVTAKATIVPGSSPLYAKSYIGTGVQLRLDNATTYTGAAYAVKYNADGSGNFTFDISKLTAGRHILTLSVNDIAGNTVQRSIEFVVGNQAGAELTADVTTARDAVTLDLAHDMSDAATTSLIIEDSTGTPIIRVDNPAWPYTWNLHTSSGRVADGFYRAFVRLADGSATTATPAVTFAVIE